MTRDDERALAAKGLASVLREAGDYIFKTQMVARQLLDRDSDLLKRTCTGFLPFYLEKGGPDLALVAPQVERVLELVGRRCDKWDQHRDTFRDFRTQLGEAWDRLRATCPESGE